MWSGGKRPRQTAAGQAQDEQSSSQAAVPVSLPALTQRGAATNTALSWALHSPAPLPSPAPAK